MSKSVFQSSEIIGFAVMLLMFVALVAGQADATLRAANQSAPFEPASVHEDHLVIDVDGELGNTVLKIAIDVASDLSYFRNENKGN